jgi:release factor glutamine methyltransferase
MSKKINIYNLSHLERLLLADLLKIEPGELLIKGERLLSKDINQIFCLKRHLLKKDYPADYLLSKVQFLDFSIRIFPRVFIPRPETEEWLTKLRKINLQTDLIIDIGCGSGIISLALAKKARKVLALDRSSVALANSNYNFKKNNQKNIISVQSYFFQNRLADQMINQSPNWWLVSNPPYVPEVEKKNIRQNNLLFEPKEAIFSQLGGLYFFQVVFKKLKLLKQRRRLPILTVFELDPRNILKADIMLSSLFRYTRIWPDYQGHPRVLTACNNHLIFDKIEQSLLD